MGFIVRRWRLGLIRYTVYKRMHRVEVTSTSSATTSTGGRAHWAPRGLSPGGRHHSNAFLVLLVLHPAVLEPDLDLPFGEVEQVGHLHTPGPAEVTVEMELLL